MLLSKQGVERREQSIMGAMEKRWNSEIACRGIGIMCIA